MNATANYELTIVIPVYNEEDNMAAVEQRLADYLPQCLKKACVLFVDDGSTDSSRQKIADICSRHPDMFYISFARNFGVTAAMKAGFDYAESPLIGYLDADLQTDPEDLNLLLPYADEYELVSGIRADRKDSGFRKFQSKFANGFRRMMTGDNAIDSVCPLKVIHADVAKRLPLFTGMHRFLPALVGLQECKFKQVPVHHHPRVAGVAKFGLMNRLVGPFKDCFAFRWMRPRWFNYKVGDSNL